MRSSTAYLLSLLIATGTGACATKQDVDRLRFELASVQVQQDSLVAMLSQLERSLSEMLDDQRSLIVTTGGDLHRQVDDMERQLVQIQALLGQSQIVLRSLRERMVRRDGTAAGEAEPDSAAAIETGGGAADARALYNAAIEQFRRGAYNTARIGFEEFMVAYPADELAPDAQYYLAETFREDEDVERAIREYSRVLELYPNSSTAPTALYKAGLLQVEQGNKDSACEYFQRVLAGYPRSDESRLARDQAQRLTCR